MTRIRIPQSFRLTPEAMAALEGRAPLGQRSARLGRDIVLLSWLLERGAEEAERRLPPGWREELAATLPGIALWPVEHCAYLAQEARRCGAPESVVEGLEALSPLGLAAVMDAVERQQRRSA